MKKIRCKAIGLQQFQKILSEYPILEDRVELRFVAKRNRDALYMHNLIFPYGVARKFRQSMIPLEDLVDSALEGYEKGMLRFFDEARDFKVGAYVVWWCLKFCTDHVINCIIKENKRINFNPFERKAMAALMARAKLEDQQALERILYLYNLLADQIEEDIVGNSELILDENERMQVVKLCVAEQSSRDGFEDYRGNISFNDFFLLNYLFAIEDKWGK